MKRTIALLLAVVMVMSLFTACKNDNAKTEEQNSTVTSSGTTSGNSVFDGGVSKPSSDKEGTATSSDDKTSSTQSGGDSGTSSTLTGETSTPSSNTNTPSSNTNTPSGNTNKPSGNTNTQTGDTSKPSGDTGTTTPDTPEMPSALKTLKGIEKYQTNPVDYSKATSWISKPTATKDVDVFFLYPTGFQGGSQDLSDIDDSAMLQLATASLMGQASVFAQSCNIYMPKYRQLSINALLKYGNEENMIYCASFDLYSALDYYFENINNGRPFIIAGHSQGSVWASVILQDYMKKHPEYLKRMVAAYVIGYSITKDYLEKNTHLKFATGANDTGVIISYNTEGVGNKNASNMVVEKGAVSINPINWKTDGTKASKSQNLGSLDHTTGKITTPGIADAQVDTNRGVVICTTVPKSMATAGFGPESYHTYDYSFYYANLMKNVADRIAAFKKK